MKKVFAFLILIFLLSCEDKGITRQKLVGDETNLPQELKGLKVYSVSCGDGVYVKVALLNKEVISTTYKEGKTENSVIILNKGSERTINVESIISENDSIIVIKKSK
jgi:hypothetical protein